MCQLSIPVKTATQFLIGVFDHFCSLMQKSLTCVSPPCSSPKLNLSSDLAVNAEVSGEHLASLQTLN